MTRRWIQERRKDEYYKKAKKLGYRSRAAFKLIEACKKHNLIKPGEKVLDIGCAPGGWLQVASQKVGPKGLVIGVDIKQIKPLPNKNIKFIKGDILQNETIEKILKEAKGKFDTIISDASPNISGIWELDHARQMQLSEKILEQCPKLLKPGGNLFLKAFQGNLLNQFTENLKTKFQTVKYFKPKASKPKSSEIYIIAKNYQP